MRRCSRRFITLLLGVTHYEFPLGTGAVLIAARVARAMHTTSLSSYLLIFFCFYRNRALKSPKIEPSLLIPEILSSKHTAKLQVEETLKGGGKGR